MKKRLISAVLAAMMAAAMLTGCGGSSSSDSAASDAAVETTAETVEEATADENGVYQADGYTYGTQFYSEEPVTYTMFFNDNDAYPLLDSWSEEGGIFYEIEKATNVHLDATIVNNADYAQKVSLAINSGEAPMIIPKIYDEKSYVNGGGVVAVSDYVQYMPNYTNFYNEYNMEEDVNTLLQEDGKYYRLPGMKETSLQDYTLLLRKDLFEGAGYDVASLEKDWTWDEFADILIDVKAYMVEQGLCSEGDYIWSDRWCGSDSGYGSGGCLLNLVSKSYGIYTTWSSTGGTNSADLYFDREADEFKMSGTSDQYKQYMKVIKKLVDNKILDPETWSQQDATADNKFYTGKTALILTNRSQTTTQIEGLTSQLGEGNFEVYRCVLPKGTTNYQAENSRLECGLMVSSKAVDELGADGFIKMMRFIDWLWYSNEGQTLTKWGIEGEDGTYTVVDGKYTLNPQYYCAGLSIAQTSEDQEDMRLKYGFACGNFMYGGTEELLTSNFSDDLQDFYKRQGEYRELAPLDPVIALSEDDSETMNLWATPLFDTENTWTLKFAMGQADVDADWDTYTAALEEQNEQNVLDMYNTYYQNSKAN